MIEKGLACLKGWIPDPDDFAGDGRPVFTFGPSSLPASHTQDHGGILLQSNNDCVSLYLSTGIRDRMLMQGTLQPRMPSRRWIYWWTRKLTGDEANDAGSQPGTAVEAVNTFGWCAEEHFDYSHDVFTEPGAEAARFAYDQRGKVKIHPLAGFDDLRLALAHDLGVGIALQVDKPFEKLAAGEIWNGLTSQAVGGHMFRLIGYDDAKQAFVIMNSWGESWADKGLGLIGYEAASQAEKYAIDWVASPSEDNPLGGALCACSGLPLPSPASCSAPSSKAVSTRRRRCPIGPIALGRATGSRTSVAKAASPRRTGLRARPTCARFRSRRRTRPVFPTRCRVSTLRLASDLPLRHHSHACRCPRAWEQGPDPLVLCLRTGTPGSRPAAEDLAAPD